MKSDAHLVRATEAHVRAFAPELRAEELAELEAAGIVDVEAMLLRGVQSELALAAVAGPDVGAMIGVDALRPSALVRPTVGQMWFLTSHAFEARPLAYLRLATEAIAACLKLYPVLVNCIDGRYTGALQLAAALGAEFGWPVALGPRQLPFIPFTIRRAAWVA